ncbi:MAG: M3 family metallopeptidase [Bdellovibrionaceae bacterium]|nr:M3 family metallopeptidase [Pseudobdellovibrionaceae bacterium]
MSDFQLTTFKEFKIETFVEKLEALLEKNRKVTAEALKQSTFNYDNFVRILSNADEELELFYSPLNLYNGVLNSTEVRNVVKKARPLVVTYSLERSQNKGIFDAYNSIKNSAEFLNLTFVQQRVVTEALKHFKLSGVHLKDEDKKTFNTIAQKLSKLETQFSNNTLDSRQSWSKTVTNLKELEGTPKNTLDLMKQKAEEKKIDGWLITLDAPIMMPLMQYCKNSSLKEEVFKKASCLASELEGFEKWNNLPIMKEILELRQAKAKILGFESFVELSLASKMASGFAEVNTFLSKLSAQTKSLAKKEYDDLKQFAKTKDNLVMQDWDRAYYAELFKKEKFKVDNEEIKQYFNDAHVIKTLFHITENLYNIKIKEKAENKNVWHPDVTEYEIFSSAGEYIAKFYLDLYARSGKSSGAWMSSFSSYSKNQKAIAYMVCNASPRVNNQPALLSHNDVITLFHEFGHGIHHLLSAISEFDLSGGGGVEWDAIEAPSQFMENFCWDPEVLKMLSKHYKTKESLSDHLIDALIASKNYNIGLFFAKQIELGLFDLRLHKYNEGVYDTLNKVREEVSVSKAPDFNRFPNSFGHIFAGGYASGYYSYIWADVLSADIFMAFKEESIKNKTNLLSVNTGKRFLKTYLSQGGAKPAMELFKDFRGREPDIDALLSMNGIKQ